MNINPYEEMETNQNSRQMDMLRQRIAQLGQFDRTIILLWLENMSYEEIGAIIGISAKNVSDRLLRHSMNARLSFFTKGNIISDIVGLALLPILFLLFNRVGIPLYFAGICVPIIILELAYNQASSDATPLYSRQ